MHSGTVANRSDPLLDALLIDVHHQIQAKLRRSLIAEVDHLFELPGGIDMQQRKGQLCRIECFDGEMQEDGAVLADRIEHHRFLEAGPAA